MNKPLIQHFVFLLNIVQPVLSRRYNVYADLGSTVLFPLDYHNGSIDPNASLRVDVYLHSRYKDDVRQFSEEHIAVYDPFYHNCSVIDENKYECGNTSGQIQITVVNVTHECIIEVVPKQPFRLSHYHYAFVHLINATSTINMNRCYTKCFLYLNEGRNINLTCGWKRSYNVSIELNGHTRARGDGIITYSFDSNRKMNHNIITCFYPAQRVIEINVKYWLFVDFKIRSGSSIIYCIPYGNPPNFTFYRWKHQSLYGEHIRYMQGITNGTLNLKNATYQDTGIYVCTVSNDTPFSNGKLKQKGSVEFTHYDSPVVKARIRPGSSIIDCSSNGIFPSVTFDKWEHQSLYGEHIRYIDGMPNGTLILGNTTYQDTGIYVCTVSNGIPDRNGQLTRTGSVEFTHYGPPVFVNDQREETKLGRIGEDILLSFTLYSQPVYNRFDIIKYNKDSGDDGKTFTSFYTLTQTLTIVRYGVTTRMKCQLGLLHITIKDRDDFGIYSAWAANIYGASFINITILSSNDESYTKNIRFYAIIFGCLSTCFVLYIIASHLRNCKNRRVTETSDQTLPLENAYDEIGTVHYHVGNLQNSGNSAEQDFSSVSNRSSSGNDAVVVGDVLSNGNNGDSDSASSTVAVLPVGYENTYQSVIEVQDRPQSHVYNECDRANVQNETQSNVPKLADYINLRF